MITRYSRPEMATIWSDESRFKVWLDVELAVFKAMADRGLADKECYKETKTKAKIDVNRINELELKNKHDVIAFLSAVAESVGPAARFMHRGMTSNDLLDTSFSIQLKKSCQLILDGIDNVANVIKNRANEFRHTVCIGRTHGIHAEPVTFGLKLAGWYAEIKRARARIADAMEEISVGKIAGAVGTYSSLPPEIEAAVLSELGLKPETVATQVVQRDRYASFFTALALMGASIERFAVEVRHLQRTEVGEAEEFFSEGQKGSSAMPHKRNPILSENICGLVRLLRSYSLAAQENVALWHERDISHSSVERVIAPDACIVADFMLSRFANLIKNLVIYPEKMMKNLNLTGGLIFSGTLLVSLVDKGVERDKAYQMVQQHAMEVFKSGSGDFVQRIRGDKAFSEYFSSSELDSIFDLKAHLQYVDHIFKRALI